MSAASVAAVRGEQGWAAWLDETVLGSFSVSTVVVALGVVLAQLSTANLVVRFLLDTVGVPAATNEKQLRGGRVLGPMDRVLLVCLGAAGELTATAIVVAAKGILRFPELQRVHRPPGADRGGLDSDPAGALRYCSARPTGSAGGSSGCGAAW